ncbi:hypothetical protein PspLS_03853 [Pyricularia sp. CBS 133598]|nr:hypothetical protein PspLS_03853 [Pyricularia sp. CBS 133598]
MAQPQAREGTVAFNPSSPHSSNGAAESCKHDGTPDTRLTAFSPEENSAKSTELMATIASGSSDSGSTNYSTNQAVQYLSGQSAIERDPFVSTDTPARKQEQKLSATASAFRPYSSPLDAQGSGDAASKFSPDQASSIQQSILSIPTTLSTEGLLSRCIVVSSSSQLVGQNDIELLLSKLGQLGSPCQGTRRIVVKGPAAYVRFSNIRDSCMVHRNVLLGGPSWVAGFVPPVEFVQLTGASDNLITNHEGQLDIFAVGRAGCEEQVESLVAGLLCSQGDVFALQKAPSSERCIYKAVLEYADTAVAFGVISKYNSITVNDITITIKFHQSEGLGLGPEILGGMTTPISTPVATPIRSSAFQGYEQDIFSGLSMAKRQHSAVPLSTPAYPSTPRVGLPLSPQYSLYRPMVFQHFSVPTPYTLNRIPAQSPPSSSIQGYPCVTPIYSSPQSPVVLSPQQELTSPRQLQGFSRPDNRRQNATRVHRSSYYNVAGHHNHVDVNRIREGTDVRTTIMLRNIPNKVDQAMLKRIVDESSWGKYDFMYLRIDFANDCNVGYAFINFVDPLDIIDFVNARGNQRWNCFKSDKVAEISYATIQGKDCLVQKFRNSSVMLEAAHYRPKLFFTSNGPMPELAGQEEPFPDPDNQSKMKRSCENAEHVGLFTPNAGQHFRDEQRRRRSQYDRGTRLAALEEYDYETAIQQLYVGQ